MEKRKRLQQAPAANQSTESWINSVPLKFTAHNAKLMAKPKATMSIMCDFFKQFCPRCCMSEVPHRDAIAFTEPYATANGSWTRSIKKYWIAMEPDMKTTQVLDVAMATVGSTPTNKKNGENTNPPQIPAMLVSTPATRPTER